MLGLGWLDAELWLLSSKLHSLRVRQRWLLKKRSTATSVTPIDLSSFDPVTIAVVQV